MCSQDFSRSPVPKNLPTQCSKLCILQGTKHEQCRWKPAIWPTIPLSEAQIQSGMVIGNKKDSVVGA